MDSFWSWIGSVIDSGRIFLADAYALLMELSISDRSLLIGINGIGVTFGVLALQAYGDAVLARLDEHEKAGTRLRSKRLTRFQRLIAGLMFVAVLSTFSTALAFWPDAAGDNIEAPTVGDLAGVLTTLACIVTCASVVSYWFLEFVWPFSKSQSVT